MTLALCGCSDSEDPAAESSSDGGTTAASGTADAGSADAGSADGPTAGGTGSDPLAGLSDEFDADSLSTWTLREQTDGAGPGYDTLAIEQGRLVLQPTAGGWYANYVGPALFKRVSGDFVIEAHVEAVSPGDGDTPPSLPFNAGGLIARDPASTDGAQDWITHNVGRQASSIATEGKTTVDSQSHLELIDGTHSGRLRICRIGSAFVLSRQLDDADAFEQTHRFDRPDLPDELQVGLMANGWNSTGNDPDTTMTPDVVAYFDYVRFWTPSDQSDCVAE